MFWISMGMVLVEVGVAILILICACATQHGADRDYKFYHELSPFIKLYKILN